MPRVSPRLAVAVGLVALTAPALLRPAPPSATSGPAAGALRGLQWRSIGPYRGGRVVAVAGVRSEPHVYYLGATGGGIWKTTDGGIRWANVSDGQLGTGSVGAVAVAESDPNVVYAGMGEGCIRGNVSHGDGVYRSTDAGRTWTHAGLGDTRQIGRVRVHPRDPDLVYVAALGHTFGPNSERGVFRSRDGGRSWQRVLYVDDRTGAIDIDMDPSNPRVLYAAFWQVVRTPWSLESGGPGSALYKTTDGGESWKRIAGEGLPKRPWGRVGVAVSPANPDRVWALVEAEEGGLHRSDDGGATWRRTNSDRRLRQRAWYYTHVHADPKNADAVYVLNVGFFRSQDGGRTFTTIRVPHADNHDLWIAPDDPLRMVNGNDGGANVSFDGGRSWSRQDNQPTAQMYHVTTDGRFPYHVYGAQQDNTTVAVASASNEGGLDSTRWHPVGGCESGYIAPSPEDPDVVYAGCYGGQITRYDRRTGQERDITVWPENPMGWGAEGMKYRFQWTFPIVFSPHDPGVLYAAGNRVFRTTDEGQTWEPISPDLTRNDPSTLGPSGGPITKDNTSVEYYGTVFAFAESAREKGVLWAGSDDGLVHLSRDGGRSWADVTPRDLPQWSLVSQIDVSPHQDGAAYLATTRYKLDDFRPYAWATTDYGRTWRRITAGLPDDSFVRVVREDPRRRGLLYAGTETGVFVSLDDGARWQPLRVASPGTPPDPAPSASPSPRPRLASGTARPEGARGGSAAAGDESVPTPTEALAPAPTRDGELPVVPVTDLVVHGDDLVASTQGRGFWILDDLSPLRQMPPALPADAHLFAPRPASRYVTPSAPPGTGANPPAGAAFYYWLAAEPKEKEEIALEVLDEGGRLLRRFSNIPEPKDAGEEDGASSGDGAPKPLPARAGLNRYVWDLRTKEASTFKGLILWAGGTRGPRVPPGAYVARLTAAGRTQSQPFQVTGDPRLPTTAAQYREQYELLLKIRDKVTETHDAISRIRDVRDQVKGAAERAKGAGSDEAIAKAAESLVKSLTSVEEALYQTKNQSNQDPLNYPIRLNNKLSALAGVVAGADAAPTASSYAVYEDVAGRIDAELAKLRAILDGELAAFNRLVREKAVPAVVIARPAA
ncbi:MAG TPA: glycosyl hydrolase [Vicinamibacteria bacterium]|nr:glycosyl hydrolase [Vicinamibacteria bacterium]